MPRNIKLMLVPAMVLLSPTLAAAQLPPVTAEQAAQGALVAAVRFEPGDLVLTRGDSLTVRAVLLDADGSPVSGALAFLFSPNGDVVQPQIGRQRSDGTFLVTAAGPGSAEPILVVRVNEDDGSFRGTPGVRQVGTLGVMVADWPVDRIEVDDLAYRPYAGTSFKITARALTRENTVHSSAVPAWRSETGEVASVTPHGVATFHKPGRARLVVEVTGGVSRSLEIEVLDDPVRRLTISPAGASTRVGDVVRFQVEPTDQDGNPVPGVAVTHSVEAIDSAGGEFYSDGTFVAEVPGTFRVMARTGGHAVEALVEAAARPAGKPVELIGHGALSHVTTSDLWVFTGKDGRDYAYTGTHAQGGGQRMFVWDVTDPASPVITDSIVVDARVVNDVKVSDDASWAIITREGASDRQNGMVVLDLADPAHPTVLAELTDGMTSGMHNFWLEGSIAYGVNDGRSWMDIVDMSDPANPRHVGHWEIREGEQDKSLHDVWGDGHGYLYLSYWDDGLVILDAGAGTHGGSATEPKFVSRIAYDMGNTHVAWRERDYVFVGDEIFGCAECTNGPRGYIHVMDVSDIDNPVEVARYEVPEAGTHNIWVEDGLLYIAYYQGGLRIVDVSGELRGDLYAQGRQVGWFLTSGQPEESVVANSPLAWGPQPFKGNIFVSDMNSGLWILKYDRPEQPTP